MNSQIVTGISNQNTIVLPTRRIPWLPPDDHDSGGKYNTDKTNTIHSSMGDNTPDDIGDGFAIENQLP